MKRLIVFIALGVSMAAAVSAQSLEGKTMYVTAKTVELKKSGAFFADTLGSLSYGAQVTVQHESGRWVEVKTIEAPVLTGWIASASLTTKRIIVSGASTSASANEIALAGKGFNEEVENAYRQSGNLNYDAIDSMEAMTIPGKQLFSFLQEGHLARGE
jgi:hypothetical protein